MNSADSSRRIGGISAMGRCPAAVCSRPPASSGR